MSISRQNPSPINIDDQNRKSYRLVKFYNISFNAFIDPEDTMSLASAHKIVKKIPALSQYMNTLNASRMVQLVCNTVVFIFQYLKFGDSWILYFTTQPSGLKQLFKCIFTNPLYGILFFSMFYLKILKEGTIDEVVFSRLTALFPYNYNSVNEYLLKLPDLLVHILPKLIIDTYLPYDNIVENQLLLIKSLVLSNLYNFSIEKILLQSFTSISTEQLNTAVYIRDRDDISFNDLDITQHMEYLQEHMKWIKQQSKVGINPKKKSVKKVALQTLTQIKTVDNTTMCLDKCIDRVKTVNNCYCVGNCSAIGGRSWCYVDETKCKNNKRLGTFMGKKFDYCVQSNVQKKCYDGMKFVNCTTR